MEKGLSVIFRGQNRLQFGSCFPDAKFCLQGVPPAINSSILVLGKESHEQAGAELCQAQLS